MDEVTAFFNNPTRPIRLKGSQTGGFILNKDNDPNELSRPSEHRHSNLSHGTSYVREARIKEEELCMQMSKARQETDSESINLNSMEQLSIIGTSVADIASTVLTEEETNVYYRNYTKKTEEKFDINSYRTKIIDALNFHKVVIIEGPTGCGKTTQVPQWILDDSYSHHRQCNIIITQPRRIAAISIAKRVAQERGWALGDLVGYQIGLESKASEATRIKYVTTGVLLQKLVSTQNLSEFTHIILDEVHERDNDMDFLLLVVKKLLSMTQNSTRVILMSATFDVSAFVKYFQIITNRGLESCSRISISPSRKFRVDTFYLDQLARYPKMKVGYIKQEEAAVNPDLHKLVLRLLEHFENVDEEESYYVKTGEGSIPSVLIFLPGIHEIEDLYNYLDKGYMQDSTASTNANLKLWLLPLHSTITADEQARVFYPAPPGHRKVILSTNIAESSITVPDIKYVIDFCLLKVLVSNDQTSFTSLQMQWASKTNCEQRAGRAGRVRDGRVYRLINSDFYNTLPQDIEPEIRRCPLDRLVLLSKMLKMGPPKDILALAMDPPDISNIQRTILVLKEMGALLKTLDGQLSWEDGDMTYLGKLMTKLPVDVRVTKMIMLGHICQCLEQTVIMGAAMTVKNIFSNPFQERSNAYNSKMTWADGSCSDCMAFLNVYKVWNHLRIKQHFKNPSQERDWARRFYLQIRSIRELDDMVRELKRRLAREGIEQNNAPPYPKNEIPLLLKIVIAGAFYPNYFIQPSSDESREREASKILGGQDPRCSVYLKDFPTDQPGTVYASSIKNVVKKYTGDEPRVIFDQNSSKVYLTFADMRNEERGRSNENTRDATLPGQIVLPVYKAVKMRQLKVDIRIPLLPPEKANEIAKSIELEKQLNLGKNQLIPKLPDIDQTFVPINISQFINCGHFWVQYNDESTAQDLQLIQHELNSQRLLAYTEQPRVGDLLAAPYEDVAGGSRQFFRVCVHKVMPQEMVWVFYIDYGSCGRMNFSNLRCLPPGICSEMPPLAVECRLAEVTPSTLLDAHGQWTFKATERFRELVARGGLYAEVYSVTHGVMHIRLFVQNQKICVNKDLIDNDLAQPTEESYESKLNHDLRMCHANFNMAQLRAYNREQIEQAFQAQREVEPPAPRDCVASAYLKGPYSPLESSVYTMMYGSQHKQVIIEWNSVNSVLLDAEPQEKYDRLLVAGSVGQSPGGDRLTLRHTTFMPYIPGLPAIVTMIFCPTLELRRNSTQTHYACALVGLGCDAAGAPLFPEHDMLLNIDVDLSVDDIGMVNHIRHALDYMMYCLDSQDATCIADSVRADVPKVIRTNLNNLLRRRRKYRESHAVAGAWAWGSTAEDETLEVEQPQLLDQPVIYPVHTPLDLRPLNRDEALALKRANEKLKNEITRTHTSSNVEVSCALCGTAPMSAHSMRIHLESRAHRDREDDFSVYDG